MEVKFASIGLGAFLVVATIIAMAAINRFRGGGIINERHFNPSGHRRLWSTPLVTGVALIWLAWPAALAFAACWLIWAALPWGRWYTMGRGHRLWSGGADDFEEHIEAGSRNLLLGFLLPEQFSQPTGRILDDHLCLLIRNILTLMPLASLALVFGQGMLIAAAIVLVGMQVSYELAWRLIHIEDGPTGHAETATGAFWGAALLAIAWGV